MIYPYSNLTQTRWDKGEFKVQLLLPGNSRPMGFCDGTAADVAELTLVEIAGGRMVNAVCFLPVGKREQRDDAERSADPAVRTCTSEE